jgi:hypothetical protein
MLSAGISAIASSAKKKALPHSIDWSANSAHSAAPMRSGAGTAVSTKAFCIAGT